MKEIEITQPIQKISLGIETDGIGLVLRLHGRLVGFMLREFTTPCTVSVSQLHEWIEQSVSDIALHEIVRKELTQQKSSHDTPTLTVAICTKDRPDNVSRLLSSLVSLQISDSTRLFEVLVVDNAPTDNRTEEMVCMYPSVQYIKEPKPGLNFARNCALFHSRTEWLAFLDDDVIVDQHWYQGWQEGWNDNIDAGAITGLVLPYELETKAQILFESRGGFGRGFEKIHYGKTFRDSKLYPCGAGIFGAGCNMSFNRKVLLDLGGFDEALDTGRPLPGGGDLDIFFRVIRAGYPLTYEPQYAVYHQHRRTINQLRHQYWTWGLGFMAYVTKSLDSDARLRIRFLRLISWWLRNQILQLGQSILGFHPLPPSMVWAELYGGVVGLLGEYARSQHRINTIRREFS